MRTQTEFSSKYFMLLHLVGSKGSSVGSAMGYGLDGQGSVLGGRGGGQSSGYREILPGVGGGDVKLTTQLQLVPKPRMVEL
jgi:hypothetical protein